MKGPGFEQLERRGHHDKDSHVHRLMSARKLYFLGSESEKGDYDDDLMMKILKRKRKMMGHRN